MVIIYHSEPNLKDSSKSIENRTQVLKSDIVNIRCECRSSAEDSSDHSCVTKREQKTGQYVHKRQLLPSPERTEELFP